MPDDVITFGEPATQEPAATNPDYPTQPQTKADYADRLAAVNASVQFTNIKGKDYAQVNQRILAFWSLFPEGRIETEKVSDDGNRCDFMAKVYRTPSEDRPAATGHAYEVKGKGVNSTSYVENCETSAVGRALGMLGIGATTSIASADEVLAAQAQQEAAQQPGRREKMPPTDGSQFGARCVNCGTRYMFNDANYFLSFKANPQPPCCPSPNWVVE